MIGVTCIIIVTMKPIMEWLGRGCFFYKKYKFLIFIIFNSWDSFLFISCTFLLQLHSFTIRLLPGINWSLWVSRASIVDTTACSIVQRIHKGQLVCNNRNTVRYLILCFYQQNFAFVLKIWHVSRANEQLPLL